MLPVHVIGADGRLLAVSFGTSMGAQVGLRHYMDYYVQPDHNDDKNLFMSHMLSQLVLIHQFYKGHRVAMSVWYTKGVENMASSLKKSLNEKLGLVNKGSSELKSYVLRRDLKAKRNSKAILKLNSQL